MSLDPKTPEQIAQEKIIESQKQLKEIQNRYAQSSEILNVSLMDNNNKYSSAFRNLKDLYLVNNNHLQYVIDYQTEINKSATDAANSHDQHTKELDLLKNQKNVELEKNKKEITILKEQIQNVNAQNKTLTDKYNQHTNRDSTLKSEFNKLQKKYNQTLSQKKETDIQLTELKNNVDKVIQLRQQVTDLRDKETKLQTEITNSNHKLDDLNNELNDIKKQNTSLNDINKSLDEKINEINKTKDIESQTQKDQLIKLSNLFRSQNEQLKFIYHKCLTDEGRQKFNDAINKKVEENKKSQQHVQTLENIEEEPEKEIVAVKSASELNQPEAPEPVEPEPAEKENVEPEPVEPKPESELIVEPDPGPVPPLEDAANNNIINSRPDNLEINDSSSS